MYGKMKTIDETKPRCALLPTQDTYIHVPDFSTFSMDSQPLCTCTFDSISEQKILNLHQNDSMMVHIQENQLLLHVLTSLPRRDMHVPDFHALGM